MYSYEEAGKLADEIGHDGFFVRSITRDPDTNLLTIHIDNPHHGGLTAFTSPDAYYHWRDVSY